MIIAIEIENKVVKLMLKKRKETLAEIIFPEERQLSEKLLPAIDELLKKNKLTSSDVEKMTLRSDIGENFTTYRIAKAVAEAWNWSRKIC